MTTFVLVDDESSQMQQQNGLEQIVTVGLYYYLIDVMMAFSRRE